MKAAVIGIGSNSVRMLVVEKTGTEMKRLFRDREGTRLFSGLKENHVLSEESMVKTTVAVSRMAAGARDAGVLPENLHVFATSASRDAANGAVFVSMVQAETGIAPQIISGEEEAVLSFLGASAVVESDEPRGVIDIGGGSTELVTGGPDGAIDTAFSCQMGAVRLYEYFSIDSRADMQQVERAAEGVLRARMEEIPPFTVPTVWVGTGGTFTALAALARGIRWTDKTYMHGTVLCREEIRRLGEELADMPVSKRLELPGLQPSRADIVVHGICILLSVMESLSIPRITVSEWGNLDGYIRKHYC